MHPRKTLRIRINPHHRGPQPPSQEPTPMTGHQVTSFVSDLMEMAKAVELVPQLQQEVDDHHATTGSLKAIIDNLQADLEQSRQYAASQELRAHTAEVSRDDAEYRFLEAQDRTDRALAFVRSVFGNAGQVIQSLEPAPAPEP